ncbi:hypothetical protein [Haladaptatus litoreus]|nr:hypothetical protein [Haladaptatus litoreus]
MTLARRLETRTATLVAIVTTLIVATSTPERRRWHPVFNLWKPD